MSIPCTRNEGTLTAKHVHVTSRRMGRKKRWTENINLTLPEGAKAKMDSVLQDGEDRLDLIRHAIDREVKRRLKAQTPDSKEMVSE